MHAYCLPQILYRDHDYDGAAVTARRFLALAGARGDTRHGGDDDYFSTDFSDAELAVRACLIQSRNVESWLMSAATEDVLGRVAV